MTKIELLDFKCKRCGAFFLSYVEGKILFQCHEEGICINSDDIGEFHAINVLHPIKDVRECRRCRKGMDIMSFELHT